MNINLDKLKRCNSIADFIREFNLGLSAKQFGYIVYGLPDNKKYNSFYIQKSNGNLREIQAPNKSLKFLQKQFANIFLQCIIEIQHKNPRYLICNHAFEKNKSIISNAKLHKRKKYLINIDISNFFASIHYGRIKGFLVNDKYFNLAENGARIIAKLATYNGILPQGSPLSPILATLIGNNIDVRLCQLANKYKMTYSRYADDITFSSNIAFTEDLIFWNKQKNIWIAGNVLEKSISRAGFEINPRKTRYSTYNSRQSVTGLTVNRHVNVNPEYKKQNRAMVFSLIKTGEFYLPTQREKIKGSLNQLIGRLNYVIHAKYYKPILNVSLSSDERNAIKADSRKYLIKILNSWHKGNGKPAIADHQTKLLRNVLFYKYFIGLDKTKIFPEGLTDPIYFQIAADKLGKKDSFSFQKINKSLEKLGLRGGTPTIQSFLNNINETNFITLEKFETDSLYPAIFILDYDQGLDSCGSITKKFNSNIGKQYVYITKNIYILLLKPYYGKDDYTNNPTCIENLLIYDNHKISTTNSKKENINWKGHNISKMEFSKIVREHHDSFKFENFFDLFTLIHEIEEDYQTRLQQMKPLSIESVGND